MLMEIIAWRHQNVAIFFLNIRTAEIEQTIQGYKMIHIRQKHKHISASDTSFQHRMFSNVKAIYTLATCYYQTSILTWWTEEKWTR